MPNEWLKALQNKVSSDDPNSLAEQGYEVALPGDESVDSLGFSIEEINDGTALAGRWPRDTQCRQLLSCQVTEGCSIGKNVEPG
ncbi:MAG TPA: hypothetical protein VK988_19975 [Acidimicrobiales bacterium]|nr:hypothetical protein [Acidimicrobiales bacterium]